MIRPNCDDTSFMAKPFITVDGIHKRFGGDFVNRTPGNGSNRIDNPKLNRAGFELCGVFFDQKLWSVVYWGSLESQFLDTISDSEKTKRLKRIFQAEPPLIILTKNFQHLPLLLRINRELGSNVPIIHSALSSVEITTTIAP